MGVASSIIVGQVCMHAVTDVHLLFSMQLWDLNGLVQ